MIEHIVAYTIIIDFTSINVHRIQIVVSSPYHQNLRLKDILHFSLIQP